MDSSPTIQCSCEEFLSVPLHIIFRQVSKRKPLLTRAEAQTLLRIMDLARELDIIVDLSSHAFERKVTSRQTRASIDDIPTLRSLVPSLIVQGEQIPDQALQHLQSELQRVLANFEASSSSLKQFSEQNWAMSDSLLDAFGGADAIPSSSAHALANEKKILSDLQEELGKRVDHLTKNEGNILDEYCKEEELSMATLCNRFFDMEPPPPRQRQQESEEIEKESRPEEIEDEVNTRDEQAEGTDEPPSAKDTDENAMQEDNGNDNAVDIENGSPRKAETAQILIAMDDEPDTCRLDEDTEPLPEMATTQTAVTTLAGLTHGMNGTDLNF